MQVVNDEAERWAAWLAMIAGGDREALGALYDEAGRLVYTTCLRVLRTPEDAEETAHDVWLQVWARAAAFDPQRGSAPAFLAVLARSRAIDRLRQRRVRAALALGDDLAEPASREPGPDQLAATAVAVRHARAALAMLPPAQRELIALSFLHEQSHAEIARHRRLPLGTAKTRIRSGLRRLRTALEAGIADGDPAAARVSP